MEDLITLVAAKNKNTIVSITAPGPVLTPWRNHVKAILCAFLPGEQCSRRSKGPLGFSQSTGPSAGQWTPRVQPQQRRNLCFGCSSQRDEMR